MSDHVRPLIKEIVQSIVPALETELEYAMRIWQDRRDSHPENVRDEDKGVESWIAWAQLELDFAQKKGYTTFDKGDALDHVRKAAGHLVRCMAYHGVKNRPID